MKPFIILLLFICITEVYSIRKCPRLTLPNGRVRVTSKGRIVNFSCDTQYVLQGYNISVCIGRLWSHPLPECVRKNSSSVTNSSTLHPIENTSTVTMAAPTISTKDSVTNKTTTAIVFSSTTKSLKSTSQTTATSLQSTSQITTTNQQNISKTLPPKNRTVSNTTLRSVTVATDITMERTFVVLIQNTTIHNMVTKATQEKANGSKYLSIGLTCAVIIIVCVIIVTIWYKRKQKAATQSTDKVQLVSKADGEEHEEWSLLV